MDKVVEFNPVEFKIIYPIFDDLNDIQLEHFFTIAEQLVDNTNCSFVTDLKERKILLYLLVAHQAALQSNINEGNNGVGRVSSATEGTVSISLDYGTMSDNSKWYEQTQYGAEYWQLIKKYRSFVYRMARTPMPVQRTYTR